MPSKYTDEILEAAYNLIVNEKYSANKASKELGIDNGTMRKRLKEKYGQIFLPDGKKKINSNFFEVIDTEEKAYWLGFLTADGYVSNGNNIELALAEVDKEHVEKFKKSIESEHAISKKTSTLNGSTFHSYRISIKDTQIANDLRMYGLTNNKSYDAYIPIENIPKELMRHYIRGLFDGDGSIYQGANGLNISIVSGSFQMKDDITNIIKEYLNLDLSFRISRNLYEVRLFSRKNVQTFLEWLYKDSTIYLNRKHNKFLPS